MKKIIICCMLFFSSLAYSQNEETVSIPKSQLTEQQKATIEKNNIESNLKKGSEWIGMGKEIGVAVNSGLSALTHHVDTLSNTKVGKLTMFLIAYKVVGKDFIGYIVIIPLICILTLIFMWVMYGCRGRNILDTESADKVKSYRWLSMNEDMMIVSTISYVIILVLLIVMMFA